MNVTDARKLAAKSNDQLTEDQAFANIWNTTYLQAILVALLRIDDALRKP